MLVDIVGVDQWLVGVMCEQALRQSRNHLFRVVARRQCLERRSAALPPGIEMVVHTGDEGRELTVPVDGGPDSRLFHGWSDVAGAEFLEQHMPQPWANV